MVDQISADRRSAVMARIKGKNTGPEVRVRKVAHAMGLRFRLNRTDLPGKPDLVFPKFRVALFVHGCFWHQHDGCRRASMPKSKTEYWGPKLRRNVERDALVAPALELLDWRAVIIWECETHDSEGLAEIIRCRVMQDVGS
ncbi:very short patch repair endonuclease [Methylopila musalis]|uniref:Very short patch repair endonuclease n=1 Tax=Methylopila musalis TaxID=1134781 RepID=A0ABW3Z5I7_9HYPH